LRKPIRFQQQSVPIARHFAATFPIAIARATATPERRQSFGGVQSVEQNMTGKPGDKATSKPAGTTENQGEGNWEAARAYDSDQRSFAESGKVEPAAEDAKRALHSKDAKELKEAERIGKSHSHGEDPALKR
jgi:hypothetical protein